MPRHRPKIAVIVQQRPAVLDASGSDQQVDDLADGDTALAQGTEKERAQALDARTLRPLRKSIQTLLSTTGLLAPCGSGQGCRANDICRKRRRPPVAAAS
jgi:hypothetical protein